MQESEIKHSQVVLCVLCSFPFEGECTSRWVLASRRRYNRDKRLGKAVRWLLALSQATNVRRCNGKLKLLLNLLPLVSRILSRIKWFVLLLPCFVNEWTGQLSQFYFLLYSLHQVDTVSAVCLRKGNKRERGKIVSYLPMVIIYWWEKKTCQLESRCRATSKVHSNC